MKKNILIRLGISITILILLFYKVGIREIYDSIIKINPLYLFPILLVYFIVLIIGNYNIKLLVDALGYKIKFWRLFKYFMLSWSIGLFIPGKLGEFSLAYFLKKEKIEVGKGLALSLMDKVITFFVSVLFAVFGFFIFFTFKTSLYIILVLIVFLVIFIIFMSKRGRDLIVNYILRKYSKYFTGFSNTFFFYIKNKKLILFFNFMITILRAFISCFTFYFLFIALGFNVSIWYILLITSITNIITLIPISISGLGIRESTATFLFVQLAIPAQVVLGIYSTLLIISYIIALIIVIIYK